MGDKMLEKVTVKSLIDQFKMECITGAKFLDRQVTRSVLSRPSVEIFGNYFDYYENDRVQIIGSKEEAIFESLKPEMKKAIVESLFKPNPPVFIFTGRKPRPFTEFLEASKKYQIPILKWDRPTTLAMGELSSFLEDQLAERKRIHGVMMEVSGVGVLLIGKSATGKSEAAIELIKRGHALIADDSVEVIQKGKGAVLATAPKLIRRLMEVRGLGLIDVVDLFGVGAYRKRATISICCKLERWDQETSFNRLGAEMEYYRIFDTDIPQVSIAVLPGRNIATMIEIACQNWRLKSFGRDAAKQFMEKQKRIVEGKSDGDEF